MKAKCLGLAAGILLSGSVLAVPMASVTIAGGSFLQIFTVTNTSTAGENILGVVYSHGAPADGIATWDTGLGGGTASDFLSSPQFFQTVTWGGLNVAPGGTFSASGLDIDLITSLVPLAVTGGVIDNVGTSLAHSFFGVTFSDGAFGSSPLNQTGWQVTQILQIGGNQQVPEPGTLALLGAAALIFTLSRRRQS